jgi:hypothetical protein
MPDTRHPKAFNFPPTSLSIIEINVVIKQFMHKIVLI